MQTLVGISRMELSIEIEFRLRTAASAPPEARPGTHLQAARCRCTWPPSPRRWTGRGRSPACSRPAAGRASGPRRACPAGRPGPSSSTVMARKLRPAAPGSGAGAAESDDPPRRPFAGIVEEVSHHLLQVLPLAPEPQALRDSRRGWPAPLSRLMRSSVRASASSTGFTSVTAPMPWALAARRARSR